MTTTEVSDLHDKLRRAPLDLVAQRVRRARRTSHLSHDEIGRRMGGVLRQTLIKWEKAKHRPGLELLTKYAEATGRQVEWFLDPDLEPSPFPDEEL